MNTENKDQVVYLYLDDIIPNRFQPREIFDEKALKELAVSIKEHGVIQPIIVRNVNGKYEIIAGERRYKASALAGLTKIPAIIRDLDDKESSKVALLENLQRKNLTPIEEARTYQKILEIDEMTQEDLAKTMGKSQSAVANKLRLLSLPDEIQNAILKEQISERHARALLNIPETQKQIEMLNKIVNNKMSVRAVEEEIKNEYQKEEIPTEEVNTINNSIEIPSPNLFINNSPLMPTSDMSEEKSTYGEIKIVPPIGEEAPMEPKFINYGEIEIEEEGEGEPLEFNNNQTFIDINDIKDNAIDINKAPTSENNTTADLDSLLNLQNMTSGPANGFIPGENKFLNPAEEIVKNDELEASNENKQDDYFKTADFIPTVNSNIPETTIASTNYNSSEAIENIRTLIKEMKEKGLSIEANELDFEKSYQVIIKLDK